ncbi:MAG TPA: YdcF family protein [Candidatus Kryptonia bacterium]
MRSRVLLRLAMLLDVIATVRIFLNRAANEGDQMVFPFAHDLILGCVVLFAVATAEFSTRRNNFQVTAAFGLSAVVFFASTFPMLSESPLKDPASVAAYVSIVVQLAGVICATLAVRSGLNRIAIIAVFLFAGLTAAGFMYTFSSDGTNNDNRDADAAVVLGASVWGKQTPSPLLKGRLDAALKLYNLGRVSKIVVTGGTKRFGTVESAVEQRYLIENGIPPSSVIAEQSTLSTSDQAKFIKDRVMGSLKMKNVEVVTDSWHLPRILLMCGWENISVTGIASNYRMQWPSELYYRVRESAALQVYLLFGV